MTILRQTTPSMREEVFSILVSRAALKSWVWSGVQGEINFTLSDSGFVSFGEIECMDNNEKRDSVIVNLSALDSLSVIDSLS